jgi:hypothetical protein
MAEIDLDTPQPTFSQCVSLDRIAYEVKRRGYYKHPTLGKMRPARRSTTILAFILCAVMILAGYIETNIAFERARAWKDLATQRQEQIDSLQMQLEAAGQRHTLFIHYK